MSRREFIEVRDEGTNKLLFEYDPVRRVIQIRQGTTSYRVNLSNVEKRERRREQQPKKGA